MSHSALLPIRRPLVHTWLAGPALRVPVRVQRPEAERGASLADLYQTHRLALVRLAVLLVDDQPTAEDVVQDAFGRLHAGWYRLRDPDAALAYLRATVVNGARSVLRRRRTARLFTPPAQTPEPGADAAALLAEEHRAVLAALARLPRRQREVLVLRYWSDLSELEVSEALRISRGTVKSTTSRALAALAAILGPVED